MLKSRVGLAALVLLASVGAARAATLVAAPVVAVEVKVGAASSTGSVRFTLVTSVNGDYLAVQAVVDQAPLDAAQKAALVIAAVENTDSTWRGAAAGGILTFQHQINGAWANVDVVSNFTDTTGAGTKLTAEDTAVAFTLAMDEGAVAFGYDAMGDSSFITVSVSDTLTWTKSLQGGETPKDILDAFQAFLAGEAGAGVTVVRTSASSLTVVLHYGESHVNWQVTDLGLQSSSSGEAVRLDDQAMLIRRGR
jgi:hypothetical protein